MRAQANIGGRRFTGDVVKRNPKTTWLTVASAVVWGRSMVVRRTRIVKRHNEKHRVVFLGEAQG